MYLAQIWNKAPYTIDRNAYTFYIDSSDWTKIYKNQHSFLGKYEE